MIGALLGRRRPAPAALPLTVAYAAPPPLKDQPHRDYPATWTAVYDQAGRRRPAVREPTQGRWSDHAGNQTSLVGFASPDLLKDLSAARATRVQLLAHAAHWYHQRGDAVLGAHGHWWPPETGPDTSPGPLRVTSWPRGAWALIDLAPVLTPQALLRGDAAGVTLGPAPDTGLRYYGKLTAHTLRLRVTYPRGAP